MRRVVITAVIIVLIALVLALLFIFLLPAPTSGALTLLASSSFAAT
jgi:hypothetical protein